MPGTPCPGRRIAPRARRFQPGEVSCGAFLDHRARSGYPGRMGRVCGALAAGGRTRLTDLAGVSLSGADEVRAQALEVAGGWSPSGAPGSWRLTAALFEAIAADDELLERLATLPPDRLPALLASAAVTFLVRRDRPVPLAGYFPEPGASQPRFDDGFFPAFRAFCAAHLTDIIEVCRSRRYQMSEVAKAHPDRPGHRGGRRRIRRPGGPGGSGHRGRARAAAGPLPVPGRDRHVRPGSGRVESWL